MAQIGNPLSLNQLLLRNKPGDFVDHRGFGTMGATDLQQTWAELRGDRFFNGVTWGPPIHQGKSRWHTYLVLVYISLVFTYLLGTVPCILTMGIFWPKINGFAWGYFTPISGVIYNPTYNWLFGPPCGTHWLCNDFFSNYKWHVWRQATHLPGPCFPLPWLWEEEYIPDTQIMYSILNKQMVGKYTFAWSIWLSINTLPHWKHLPTHWNSLQKNARKFAIYPTEFPEGESLCCWVHPPHPGCNRYHQDDIISSVSGITN